jgi:hypothetical protein
MKAFSSAKNSSIGLKSEVHHRWHTSKFKPSEPKRPSATNNGDESFAEE